MVKQYLSLSATVVLLALKTLWCFSKLIPPYIVEGDVVSAAEASRMLGVSAGRITHMLDAGVLDGYREGRRTWVSVASIEKRLSEIPKAGRPRKAQMA